MILNYKFHKYQAAGNDFILIENNQFPALDASSIIRLCKRKYGIGADGLLWLRSISSADYYLHIFNSDGQEATMCGNALRIVGHHKGVLLNQSKLRVQTASGFYDAAIEDDIVWICMDRVALIDEPEILMNHKLTQSYLIDSGVLHLIIPVEDIQSVDLDKIAPSLRKQFDANVSIYQYEKEYVHMRTFEKGVEAQTHSCGTGATAVAFILPDKQITIQFSRDQLLFHRRNQKLWMSGPVCKVYEGFISDPLQYNLKGDRLLNQLPAYMNR